MQSICYLSQIDSLTHEIVFFNILLLCHNNLLRVTIAAI